MHKKLLPLNFDCFVTNDKDNIIIYTFRINSLTNKISDFRHNYDSYYG